MQHVNTAEYCNTCTNDLSMHPTYLIQNVANMIQELQKVLAFWDAIYWRSSLIRVFPVCYSDKHFGNNLNSSLDNHHFIWEQLSRKVSEFLEYLRYRLTWNHYLAPPWALLCSFLHQSQRKIHSLQHLQIKDLTLCAYLYLHVLLNLLLTRRGKKIKCKACRAFYHFLQQV